MFLYPKDILKELKQIWYEPSEYRDEEIIAPLPPDKVLLEIMEVAYHASLEFDEARRTQFRLIFENSEMLKEVNKEFSIVRFTQPRQFNVMEVRKLAQATDIEKMFIGLQLNSRNKLEIWGILDITSSWWRFMHEEFSEGANRVQPPNSFSISSSEAGNVSILRFGREILSLRNGKVQRSTRRVFYQGPVAWFFRDTYEVFYEEICRMLEIKEYDPDPVENEFPFRVFMDSIEQILFTITNRGHGGTVLFIKEQEKGNGLKRIINLKYQSIFSCLWKDLIHKLVVHHRYRAKINSIGINDLSYFDFMKVRSLFTEKLANQRTLRDTIQMIASFSGVDGAILMTDKLNLLGFGGEILSNATTLRHIRKATDQEGLEGPYIPIEQYGTRNRSAFRFCDEYPNSLAFVISQDGDVKAIRKMKEDLCYWPASNMLSGY